MLTLFTVAKVFQGEFALIQRNAIRSWRQLHPACEILLLGEEEGISEIAAETGARQIKYLERNESGTPLLSSIFAEAERHAKFPVVCYINADILLLRDFLPAVRSILSWNQRCLIVGRRWDMQITSEITATQDWEKKLRARMETEASPHPHTGMDFFVFPKGLWGQLPPFAIGRGIWDGWLLYQAKEMGVPIVDATERLTAVHQNHSYAHHPEGAAGVWHGIEAQRNLALGGGVVHSYTLRDATHRLTGQGVRPRILPWDLRRSLVVPLVTRKWMRPLVQLKKTFLQQTY